MIDTAAVRVGRFSELSSELQAVTVHVINHLASWERSQDSEERTFYLSAEGVAKSYAAARRLERQR